MQVVNLKWALPLAGAVFVAAAYLIWVMARDDAQHACVASVHAGLAQVTDIDPEGTGVEWRILDERQSDRLISIASKSHPFDCRALKPGEPLRDDWGNPLKVAVRRSPTGGPEYRVWSAGRDRGSGTWDDIVSPYGEKAMTPE